MVKKKTITILNSVVDTPQNKAKIARVGTQTVFKKEKMLQGIPPILNYIPCSKSTRKIKIRIQNPNALQKMVGEEDIDVYGQIIHTQTAKQMAKKSKTKMLHHTSDKRQGDLLYPKMRYQSDRSGVH